MKLAGYTRINGSLPELTRPIFSTDEGRYVLGLMHQERLYMPLNLQRKLLAILAQVDIPRANLDTHLVSGIPSLSPPRDPGYWLSREGYDSTSLQPPILITRFNGSFNGSAKSIHLNSGHKFGVLAKKLVFKLHSDNSIYDVSPRVFVDFSEFRLTKEELCDEKGELLPADGDTSEGGGGDDSMEESES